MGDSGSREGMLASITDKLIRALPPGMLVLILINAAFVFAILWVVNANADHRNALLTKIVESCLTRQQ